MSSKLSILLITLFTCLSFSAHAQWPFGKNEEGGENKDKLKVYQNSRGVMLGYERGKYDMLQLGYHYNWKKIRLKRPVIRAVEGYLEYAPFGNIFGAKAAYWQRHGRLKYTYGGHVGYFTDFDESSLSIGPSAGFRLLGFHGQLGYNLLFNPEVEANRLYLSISLFIPSHTRLFSRKGNKEKDILKW